MESNNTFQGGMDSDISKLFQSSNAYKKAINFRALTELGSSNGSLVNIKGNNCEISFPEVRAVYKLRIKSIYDVNGVFVPGVMKVTINGQTSVNINITANTTVQDIYNTITLLTNCDKNSNPVNPTFSIAYNTEDIVLYQTPTYTGCNPTQGQELSITLIRVSGASGFEFIDTVGNYSTTQTAYIPSLTGTKLVVIGSTFIGETFYLYTCPYNNPNEVGHIWEMSYNELSRNTTIKLIYNSYLNFSINYPIAPSATIGRYELDSLQRIYWTDYNNPVRSVNVKDPNLMATPIEVINLVSSVDFSKPVLYNILDGQAVMPNYCNNTYQCAYRLKKNNGAITNYSVLSDITYLTPIDDTNPTGTGFYERSQPNYASLKGAFGPVNKAIQWEIDGVDTDYDVIEFVVVARTAPNIDTFIVYKFDEQIINGQETFRTIFYNDPDVNEEISIDEFLLENTSFTHCKSIESKDNRLFFANVKNDLTSYLDTYDSRAFRFHSNTSNISVMKYESDSSFTTYSGALNNNFSTPSDYAVLPENADMIPMCNLGLDTSDHLLWNPDVAYQRNSFILGGTGPNISYKFGSVLLRSDGSPNEPVYMAPGGTDWGTSRDNNTSALIYKNGYRKAAGVWNFPGNTGLNPYNNNAPYQEYKQNNIKMTMGLEYLSGTFKSYARNEIYRFGIQFYSKTGTTNFVKWIGDIKFPGHHQAPAPGLAGQTDLGEVCPDFRSMYYSSSGSGAYSVVPYIEFDINIPDELADLISGCEIVRVERKDKDIVIGEFGLITQVSTGVGSEAIAGNMFLPPSHSERDGRSPHVVEACNPPTTGWAAAQRNVLAFHTYKELCDNNTNLMELNDKLILTEKYNWTVSMPVNPSNVAIGGMGFEEHYYIDKYYQINNFIYGNNTYAFPTFLYINEAYYVGRGGESPVIQIAGSGVYKNYNFNDTSPVSGGSGSYDNRAYSLGSPTVVIGLRNNIDIVWEDHGASGDTMVNSKLMALHYKPSNLSTQYGGRTYLARANNEYISTGAYYPVRGDNGVKTIKAFGGDIYHGVLDIHKCIKNFVGPTPPTNPIKHSQTWYFPVQSRYNVDLREGVHVNSDLNTDDGVYPSASWGDEYINYQSYNYENTVRKFIPRPIFFNETNVWNNRIYWSEVKFNGETSDSWTNIPVNNFYDLEGNYGPINALVILRNLMYAIQDRALATLLINPQSLINDQNNTTLKLGNGATLEKHMYVSVDAGSKHQWSVYRSSSHISFVDVRTKKIYIFDGQQLNPISDTKGNRGFVQKVLHDNILIQDNPIVGNGILTTYDFKNNEFLYTFRNYFANVDLADPLLAEDEYTNEKYTLAYSDLLQRFNAFYSFTPYIYLNNNSKLYSPREYDPSLASKLYLHDKGDYCKFYDTVYKSSLKLVVNTNPKVTKTFNNLSLLTESIDDKVLYVDDINDALTSESDVNQLYDTFNRVRFTTEYQNTDWIVLDITNPITTMRKSEQGFNIQIPRNKCDWDVFPIGTYSIYDPNVLTKTTFGDRIRDKSMIIDLEYDNADNNRLIVHSVGTNFTVSDR